MTCPVCGKDKFDVAIRPDIHKLESYDAEDEYESCYDCYQDRLDER